MLDIVLAPVLVLVGIAVMVVGWRRREHLLIYGGAVLISLVAAALVGLPWAG